MKNVGEITEEILEILENNSKFSVEQIAVMLDVSSQTVKDIIRKLESENVIAGYKTIVDWDKTPKETITALIEVKVTPQKGEGFDKIAERIFRYPEVKACYLMSGGFDFTVILEGSSLKEVAFFVAEKLAPLDAVISTATHFVLKKYKDNGTVFESETGDDREVVVL